MTASSVTRTEAKASLTTLPQELQIMIAEELVSPVKDDNPLQPLKRHLGPLLNLHYTCKDLQEATYPILLRRVELRGCNVLSLLRTLFHRPEIGRYVRVLYAYNWQWEYGDQSGREVRMYYGADWHWESGDQDTFTAEASALVAADSVSVQLLQDGLVCLEDLLIIHVLQHLPSLTALRTGYFISAAQYWPEEERFIGSSITSLCLSDNSKFAGKDRPFGNSLEGAASWTTAFRPDCQPTKLHTFHLCGGHRHTYSSLQLLRRHMEPEGDLHSFANGLRHLQLDVEELGSYESTCLASLGGVIEKYRTLTSLRLCMRPIRDPSSKDILGSVLTSLKGSTVARNLRRLEIDHSDSGSKITMKTTSALPAFTKLKSLSFTLPTPNTTIFQWPPGLQHLKCLVHGYLSPNSFTFAAPEELPAAMKIVTLQWDMHELRRRGYRATRRLSEPLCRFQKACALRGILLVVEVRDCKGGCYQPIPLEEFIEE